MSRILILLTLLFVLTTHVGAQTTVYPIKTFTTVVAPSPVSLEEIYAGAGEKLVLQVIVSDVTLSNYPVKFKINILGPGIEISTPSSFNPEPTYINGGETQLFSGKDLETYFNIENLQFNGYSQAQYKNTGRLPEGAYRLSIDVVDYYRNVTVSKSIGVGQMYIFENEPPDLTFPFDKEIMNALSPQNILLSWVPRHNPYSSPTFVPEYKFELWEIWPDEKTAYEIVQSTEPIFTTTTQTQNFFYTVNEPLLFTGRKYAWRVQVIDPENIVRFKQDGYSKVRTFQFGKLCPVPEPEIEKTGTAHIVIKWEGDYRQTKYEVRYREKKGVNREWYTKTTTFLSADIDNLKSNNEYEFQVAAFCDDQPGEYSEILTASTKEETTFKCGATPPNPSLSNTTPLDKLNPRDVIRAGDFDVMVSSASGSGGTFSGKGWVLVPYLKYIKIEVEFSGIFVNNEYRLTAGEIKTVYNINNSLVARIGDLSWMYSDKPKAVENNGFTKITNIVSRPDSTVSSITVNNGVVTIKTDNGQTINVRTDNNKIVAITPQNGTSIQYVADTKTNTVYSATPETNKSNANTANVTPQPKAGNTKYKVDFITHPQEECGIDYPSDKHPAQNYETLQFDGKSVNVPWKSIEAGKFDRLVANVTGGSVDSVRYRRESEQMVMIAPGIGLDVQKFKGLLNSSTSEPLNIEPSNLKQLLLSAESDKDEDKLYAWYPEYEKKNDTLTIVNRVLAGQMNLVSYEKIALTVHLVSVNKSTAPDAKKVQEALDKIFKGAVVKWTVSAPVSIDVALKNGKSQILDITDKNDKMDYTPEMDKVISAMKNATGYISKDFYLFFFDGFTQASGGSIVGYMPFNRQFGFLKTTSEASIAHELSHGAFRLRHTFSESSPILQPQGTTDNLMDYVNQSALANCNLLKYQWDEIHDVDLGLNWGEDEEEGEIVKESCFADNANYIKYKSIKEKLLVSNNDFKVIYEFVDQNPIVTYCISEYSEKEKENSQRGELGMATPYTKRPKMLMTFKTTDRIINQICIYDYLGDINLNQDNNQVGYNEFTIFHEFCHAAQFLHYGVDNSNTNLLELEARVVYLFSLYKKAGSKIAHDRVLFREYVIKIAGETSAANYPFLYPQEDLKDENGYNIFYYISNKYKNGFEIITAFFDAKQKSKLTLNDDSTNDLKKELKSFFNSWTKYLVEQANYNFQTPYDWDNELPFFQNIIK